MTKPSGAREKDGMSQSDSATVSPNSKPKRSKPRLKPVDQPRRQPSYAVIVENDDDHTYPYVIDGLCRVCGHSKEKAFKLAEQIDHSGQAVVWTGMLEVAELKRDQIKGLGPDFYAVEPVLYPLGVRLEPLPQ